jgi:hypothetical protein
MEAGTVLIIIIFFELIYTFFKLETNINNLKKWRLIDPIFFSLVFDRFLIYKED